MTIELPIVLTPEQLVAFLGWDRSELYRAMREGRVPGAYRAGKRWYIGRDRFLKAVTGSCGKSKLVVR